MNANKKNVEALKEEARAKGATEIFVTPEGYTKLPEAMLRELRLTEGSMVWFLRGKDVWEAWPEEKLDDLLREKRK